MLRGLVCDYGGVLTDLGVPARGEPPLLDVLRRLRRGGVRTALLSNADTMPQPGIRDLFDCVLLSGETGIAKPDPAGFRLAAQRLGLKVGECVFVDDVPGYVRAAVQAGMVGVHHRNPGTTIAELDVLFSAG
jgi:HAD superfamily hydrolase (TIGR01509 family)